MKRKIFLISDHSLSTSGVGTQSHYLINGLIATGKYSFICFGAALRHDDYKQITVNPDYIIKPIEGFGTIEQLRLVLSQERPDAMMLFTDPRFFIDKFEHSDEIHQICPLIYNHLWDNGPPPTFNKVLYESCDLINCINYHTYEFCHDWFPDHTNFVPHAVPVEFFHPLKADEIATHRKTLLQGRPDDTFIGLWVSRNARRKVPSDVIYSFKLFLDELEARHGHRKGLLVMHTEPLDPEGPNLYAVVQALGMEQHVMFSRERYPQAHMNIIYNCADTTMLRSSAEGFGLSMLESMMAGTPIIALKTGGLTRQVVDHRDGSENGIAVPVEVKSLVGSQQIPFIWDDYCSHETFTNAILKMYEFGPEKRAQLGNKAMEYAHFEYGMERLIGTWDRTLTETIDKWKSEKLSEKQWCKVTL
jgi:glycosyltransferase involved in cell wall biosynthesis